MFLIALVLRLALITIGHTYKFKTRDDNFSFGFEMGRIGQSLALGQGFADPFDGVTGPTAWEPPLYPLLIAGVFKLFGIYTHASAFVLLSINSVFSALTCIPIFLIARRCFGNPVAVWSGWLWALLPNVMYWCTRWVWETSLAALLLALTFWLALVMEEREGPAPWLQFGVLWVVTALTNTSLLSFLPVSGLWVWHRRAKLGKRSLGGVALAALVFTGCITPWLVRNSRTFGRFVFIRSNFGAELRLGNGPGATGLWMDYLHPTKNAFQLQLYRQMGEQAYIGERKREAVDFIGQDYGRFAELCLRRFVYFWAGLPRSPGGGSPLSVPKNWLVLASSALAFWGLGRALHKGRPGAGLFAWLIVTYPVVYYFLFFLPRYRHPIEPELGILIVYAISDTTFRRRAS